MQFHVKVFGTDWCPDTQRTRTHLERLGVDYKFIDIDADAHGEEQVIEAGNGKRKIPLVELQAQGVKQRLVEPSNEELDRALVHRAA